MAFDRGEIKNRFPLHYLVWLDDKEGLKKHLKTQSKPNLEQKDPRGRTALMLAVTLGHKKCARILLNNNANVNVTDASGFNVLHEAVTSSDPEFIRDVYEQKEVQRYSSRVDGIPNLLSKICDTTDFYLEMKWEFTSWVPLVSRLCPNDTYKIYKSGSKVRVDTTLVGMDTASGSGIAGTPNWQRGRKSFIFSGSEDSAVFMEIDHEEKQIQKRIMKVITQEEILEFLQPTEEQICDRLSNPICTTFIDTEKIAFERAKSGIIGFRSDRSETINGYECKVYSASNVELVTKTRTEHLTANDKERLKGMENSRLNSLRSWAGIVETHHPNSFEGIDLAEPTRRNPWKLSLTDYFNAPSTSHQITQTSLDQACSNVPAESGGTTNAADQTAAIIEDIGVPREMTTKTQHFKANLWLSEEFPLSLPEQVLPIVDLMALSSSHFAKLRDFIAAKLPAGFPVKIEIPLFHLLNARITFGNIFATGEPVPGVTPIPLDTEANPPRWSCTVDEDCFLPPPTYEVLSASDLDDGPAGLLGPSEQLYDGTGSSTFQDDDYSDAWQNYLIRNTCGDASANYSAHSPNIPSTRPLTDQLASSTHNARSASGREQVKEQMTFLEAIQSSTPIEMIDADLQRAIQLSLLEYQHEQQQSERMQSKSMNVSAANCESDTQLESASMPNGIISSCGGLGNDLLHPSVTKQDAEEAVNGASDHPRRAPPQSPSDEALQATIEASRLEAEQEAERRRAEEEELSKVLQLSLMDK